MPGSEPPSRHEGAAPGLDRWSDELDRWSDEVGAERAASERERARSLRLQAWQTSDFAALLLDLAERRQRVVVHAAGRRLAGSIRGLGVDFVALALEGRSALIRLWAVTAVEPLAEAPGPGGPRDTSPAADLLTVLAALADLTAAVTIVSTDGSETFAGDLVLVAEDFVAVRPDGRSAPVYLPLPAVGVVESAAFG